MSHAGTGKAQSSGLDVQCLKPRTYTHTVRRASDGESREARSAG
jgi:hypothetical protein